MNETAYLIQVITQPDCCEICATLTDTIHEIESAPRLPLHDRCRCENRPVPRTDANPTPPLEPSELTPAALDHLLDYLDWLTNNQLPIPYIWTTCEELAATRRKQKRTHTMNEAQTWQDDINQLADLMLTPAGRVTLTTENPLALAAGNQPRKYAVQVATAGRIRATGGRPGRLALSPAALADAVARRLLVGAACFIDHATIDHPSLTQLAGVIEWAEWDNENARITAELRLYPSNAGETIRTLFDAVLQDATRGAALPDIGLSLTFWPDRYETTDDPEEPITILSLRKIDSVDFVFQPAAEGRILEQLSTMGQQTATAAAAPGLKPSTHTGGEHMDEQPNTPTTQQPQAGQDWADALRTAAVPALLAASGLPAPTQELLRQQSWQSPAALENAIELHRSHLAQLQESNVVQIGGTAPRDPQISLGRTGTEQVQLALEALLSGTRPPEGIRPLTGVRELYHIMSGDYEMTGRFYADRVYLAAVTSSTMAGMLANALNKRVTNLFMEYPQWWLPIVSIEDFQTLQTVRWITLGGVGELPTVAEGASYTELTWDDKAETSSFVKKGGYLGITMEAIDKDDTTRLRAVPRALAQAAWLTLGKAVSAIFTDNTGTGPTLADSYALFEAAHHVNLLTTALSYAAYKAVRTAMRKQTELNSSERMGALTAPKFLLVPPDLEIAALQVLASEYDPSEGSTTSFQAANPFAEGDSIAARMQNARNRVIVVDLWTDTNNWAAVADPKLYPSIGLGFRYGRTPEVYSVASPTAGLMFTNDTMPVKVRFFFAVGPTDYRGLHKNNVA